MLELIIFDVDGTLAKKYTLDLLPGAREFFDLALNHGCPQALKLAIATNQGGVGMRYWMESRGFGKPEKYPTQSSIEERMRYLAEMLNPAKQLPVYVSFSYRTKGGKYAPIPQGQSENSSWRRDWRKPEPGMLIQAMQDAGAAPADTLYVGDSPDDQRAAQAAGCHFAWAGEFFSHTWQDCEDLLTSLRNLAE